MDLSNAQIAQELGLTEKDCHGMTSLLREGVDEKRPQEILEGEVALDELYLVAGHKGKPNAVKKKRKARRRRLKGKRGRGIAADDKPPVLGMIQRNGLVIINVQRTTIEPIIRQFVQVGRTVYTAKYNLYSWLSASYTHHPLNPSTSEYAREEDGNGK